jgi:hypothetical protein
MPVATEAGPRPRVWSLPAGEIAWLTLFAGLLIWRLLLPGFVGLADNGDFAKVAGPLCLGTHPEDRFFYASFPRGAEHCYDSGLASSEVVLAWVASRAEQCFASGRFDIRWLGALHGFLLLAIFGAVLGFIRPLGLASRTLLSFLAVWIFSDIALLAYLNSFYADVAAVLGGLGAVAAAAHFLVQRGSLPLAMFAVAGLLLVTSKSQHCLLGLLLCAIALLFGWVAPIQRRRCLLIAAILLAATGGMLARTPPWYGSLARFSLIFASVLKNTDTASADLVELGLEPADARFVGLNAFEGNGPMDDAVFAARFQARTSFARVARFYLRHPGRVWAILRVNLVEQAWQRRPLGLSNLLAAPGRPAGAIAVSPADWSALRTWMFSAWPPHIVVWLLLAPLLALLSAAGSPWRRALAWVLVGLSVAAGAEFAIATLVDAAETARHLWMFHVFSDASLLFGAICLAGWVEQASPERSRKAVGLLLAGTGIGFGLWVLEPFRGGTDDTDETLAYSGKWSGGAFGRALRGSLTYSGEPGAFARFGFSGSEFTYRFTKAPNRGIAEVWVDGEQRAVVDQYAPDLVWRACAVIGGLKVGPHNAEIRVTGRKNPASQGQTVDIDFLAN